MASVIRDYAAKVEAAMRQLEECYLIRPEVCDVTLCSVCPWVACCIISAFPRIFICVHAAALKEVLPAGGTCWAMHVVSSLYRLQCILCIPCTGCSACEGGARLC